MNKIKEKRKVFFYIARGPHMMDLGFAVKSVPAMLNPLEGRKVLIAPLRRQSQERGELIGDSRGRWRHTSGE